jgi:hypothetical protein
MKFPSLDLLLTSLLKTVRRFPLAVIVAVIATVLSLILVEHEHTGQDNTIFKILLTCALAMPLFFSFHAVFERGKKTESFVLLGVGALMLALFYVGISAQSPKNDVSQIWVYRFFMWNGAFHLVAAFCTFYFASEMNGFWQWNKNLFLSFLLATLYSGVLYAGLALALAAITQLFGIELHNKIYGDLWVIIALFFQPLIFLGSIPSPINDLQEDESYPNGLRIFTQYILLPLVAIYFVILYIYMGKILIQWSLPKGWVRVSYLIIGFSVSGILSFLLLHPLAEKEEYKWIRLANTWYYRLLIPLFILMFVSIFVRVQTYGITPNRYIILVLALWLGVIAIYFSFSSKRNIIFIPLSLAIIGFLCSFGPWGIFSASVNSQTKALQAVLSKHHLFEKGKFVAAPENNPVKMTSSEEDQIRTSIDLLNDLSYGDNLRSWIPQEWAKDSLIDEYNKVNTYKLSAKLGIEVSGRGGYENPDSPTNIYLNCDAFSLNKGLKVAPYQNFATINACEEPSGGDCYENEQNVMKAFIRNDNLVFYKKDTNEKDSVSLVSIIEHAKTFDLNSNTSISSYQINPAKMQVEIAGKAKFLIFQATLKYNPKTQGARVTKIDGYLLHN